MIAENIAEIKKEIETIVSRTCWGGDVILLAATKGIPPEKIKEAISVGVRHIGENYIQEARKKYSEITDWCREKRIDIKWHFIGHLQKNKVKYIDMFDLIQSVDSIEIAEEINNYSHKKNKITPILLQVNISGEKTKFGIKKEHLIDNIERIGKMPNLKIQGLMTIAPMVDNPEEVRPLFREMRSLYDEIKNILPVRYLSMGMSQDWRVAIQEGANMIRLRTAIFERR